MGDVTKGFKSYQNLIKQRDNIYIFYLNQIQLKSLIELKFNEREAFIRHIFEKQ